VTVYRPNATELHDRMMKRLILPLRIWTLKVKLFMRVLKS